MKRRCLCRVSRPATFSLLFDSWHEGEADAGFVSLAEFSRYVQRADATNGQQTPAKGENYDGSMGVMGMMGIYIILANHFSIACLDAGVELCKLSQNSSDASMLI